jgi:hypothetical protein
MKETNSTHVQPCYKPVSSAVSWLLTGLLLLLGFNISWAGNGGGPNCTDITASIDADGMAHIQIGELVTNCDGNVTQITGHIENHYGGYMGSIGPFSACDQEINGGIEACQYLRNGVKILIKVNGTTCWSNVTFHHPDGPIIEGDEYHLYCLDPAVTSVKEFLNEYDKNVLE